MSELRVAIAGATGAVGQEMMRVLEAREFPVSELILLASANSRGKKLSFRGEDLTVQVLERSSFRNVDVALFSAGGGISREFAPAAVEAGAVVVDNSSAFRYEPEIPLVVPEVNPEALSGHNGIIANPNCSTIILVVGIAPIHRLSPLRRIVASTYQAASGAGAKGMDALRRELGGESGPDGRADGSPFPHRLAGNLIPRIDTLQDGGYTREEMKMVWETRKIMGGLENTPISATCVRVPVERAHSESVQLTTETALSLEDIRRAISEAPGVRLQDDPAQDVYPTPLAVSGEDDVFVGRLRQHPDEPATYDLWIVGDQIRKGAALNAVQVAEKLFC